MPPQLIRLVLLTIGIVCVYFTARYFLTPDSFGQFGHYRGKALAEIAAREPYGPDKGPATNATTRLCKNWPRTEHQGLSCETCHGPSQAHVESPEVKLPKMSYDKCVRCHAGSPSRPQWLHQINLDTHYTGNVCTRSAMIPTNPSHEQ